MSKPGEDLTDNPLTVLEGWFRGLVREEIQAANQNSHQGGDHLLDTDQAAEILSVSKDWLYRYGPRLGLTRKLAPRVLRFSYLAIQKYIVTRKNS